MPPPRLLEYRILTLARFSYDPMIIPLLHIRTSASAAPQVVRRTGSNESRQGGGTELR
jgi:hypothetical protein